MKRSCQLHCKLLSHCFINIEGVTRNKLSEGVEIWEIFINPDCKSILLKKEKKLKFSMEMNSVVLELIRHNTLFKKKKLENASSLSNEKHMQYNIPTHT